jgi:hypothetical protein
MTGAGSPGCTVFLVIGVVPIVVATLRITLAPAFGGAAPRGRPRQRSAGGCMMEPIARYLADDHVRLDRS